MSRQVPYPAENPARQWRLKPARQDALNVMGFVSKGDLRLLSPKAQDEYYRLIVSRFMHFCAQHHHDLDATFVLLAKFNNMTITDTDHRVEPELVDKVVSPLADEFLRWQTLSDPQNHEISRILEALRKLREGILASSLTKPSPIFAQRVHVFNIRLAILAMSSESYHPSLTYLLNVLHTPDHPLPRPELIEMTTYAILDLALRQNDSIAAYSLRYKSKIEFGYDVRKVDAILQAIISDNWVSFWRVWRTVDGYIRALMHNHFETMRKTVLKAFGKAYHKTDLDWLMRSATGRQMTWDELVQAEQVGWQRDGSTITIRRPKAK